MMGALEADDGMLLFGTGTAYIFALMQMQRPMSRAIMDVGTARPIGGGKADD
jgi:hypothetical protein